jgi:hypothetical protein
MIPTSNQDGHQAKNRKKGDEFKRKPDIFLEENHPMTISSTFSSY